VARVLISGATGLIGRRVLEAYRGSDDEVVPLGRSDADLLETGAWRRMLDDKRPDIVIHLAWSASTTLGYREHDDNARWAESTIAVAALAADRGIRFVATGTAVDDSPADDPYSRSKATARDALADRIAAGELAWLRPFYVFDEEGPSPAVLRAALQAKAALEPVALASPDARHDFVHARDVGTAIRAVVEGRLAGAIDIGSGAVASVSELVESYGCQWVAQGIPSSSAASEAAADVAALRATGWVPLVTNARLGRDTPRG
jgi:nucleoside-diphosphate-sugar epimerase